MYVVLMYAKEIAFPRIFLLNHAIDIISQQQGLKMHVSKILFIFSLFKKHLFKPRAISC